MLGVDHLNLVWEANPEGRHSMVCKQWRDQWRVMFGVKQVLLVYQNGLCTVLDIPVRITGNKEDKLQWLQKVGAFKLHGLFFTNEWMFTSILDEHALAATQQHTVVAHRPGATNFKAQGWVVSCGLPLRKPVTGFGGAINLTQWAFLGKLLHSRNTSGVLRSLCPDEQDYLAGAVLLMCTDGDANVCDRRKDDWSHLQEHLDQEICKHGLQKSGTIQLDCACKICGPPIRLDCLTWG
jgi:hypothetical protein